MADENDALFADLEKESKEFDKVLIYLFGIRLWPDANMGHSRMLKLTVGQHTVLNAPRGHVD